MPLCLIKSHNNSVYLIDMTGDIRCHRNEPTQQRTLVVEVAPVAGAEGGQ